MIYKVENESPNPVEQTTAPAGPAHAVAGHSENSDSENSDLQMRLDLARQFGNTTIAYSTVCQPGLKYHYSHDGFQAYGTKWGYDYGLGDSVVAPSDTGKLLDEFIGSCKKKPCFVHITKPTAEALAERGYYINQFGVDTWLELDSYDFKGKTKEHFRYAANWLNRRGYRVEEHSFSDIDQRLPAEISRRWRATRPIKDREVGFMNRPLVFQHEPDVRHFYLFDSDDNLQAFVYLDPVYENGQIIGYSTVFKRRDPDAPAYAEQGIMKHCVEKLKQEGCQTLRLGLSPLANMTDRTFKKRNGLIHFGWSYGFKAWWVNRYFYNLQGHAAFKRRFRGTEHPVYFATPVLINDVRIAGMLRLMGVLGGQKS